MVVLSFSLMAYMVAKGSKPSGTGQVEGSNLTALISDNGNSFFQGQILKYFMINLPLWKPYKFFLTNCDPTENTKCCHVVEITHCLTAEYCPL